MNRTVKHYDSKVGDTPFIWRVDVDHIDYRSLGNPARNFDVQYSFYFDDIPIVQGAVVNDEVLAQYLYRHPEAFELNPNDSGGYSVLLRVSRDDTTYRIFVTNVKGFEYQLLHALRTRNG